MTKIYVDEIDLKNGCKHIRRFTFPLDGGKDFCYRSRVSVDSFGFGIKGKNYRPNKKNAKFLYCFMHEDHFEMFIETEKRSFGDYCVNLPEIKLNSIWEFYNVVGYDYKTQKWS